MEGKAPIVQEILSLGRFSVNKKVKAVLTDEGPDRVEPRRAVSLGRGQVGYCVMEKREAKGCEVRRALFKFLPAHDLPHPNHSVTPLSSDYTFALVSLT